MWRSACGWAAGLLPDGRALIPLGGPLGLAVLGSRLDFKHWAVTPLGSSFNTSHTSSSKAQGQLGASTGAYHQQASHLEDTHKAGSNARLSTSDTGAGSPRGGGAGSRGAGSGGGASVTGGPGSHFQPGSPAAAKEAFKGLSASAATAVAVSATAHANNRWVLGWWQWWYGDSLGEVT